MFLVILGYYEVLNTIYEMFLVKPIGSKLINMIIAKKKQLYALLLKLI